MNKKYTPTEKDMAVCAALGPMHWTPEQRAAIRRHADTIVPHYEPTDEECAAETWMFDLDNTGNGEIYDRVMKFGYTYGETGIADPALEYLVEIVESRYAEKAYYAACLDEQKQAAALANILEE